jgi:hypothetical protein
MRTQVAHALEQSSLSQAKEAALAMLQGWHLGTLESDGVLSANTDTVEKRLKHLSAMPGEYAAQLTRSLQELLSAIRDSPETKYSTYTLRGDAEHHFIVYFVPLTTSVVGCLRVTDHSTAA